MANVTIDEGLQNLQAFTLDFLKALHAYIQRVEERKDLYRELRRLALAIGLTEAELPPPVKVGRGPGCSNPAWWTPERREAARQRALTRNAARKEGADK